MERSQDHPDVSYPVTRRRRENSLEMQFHWKMIGLENNWSRWSPVNSYAK